MHNKRKKPSSILNRRRGKRFYNSSFSEEQKHRGIIMFLYDKGIKDLSKVKQLLQVFHDHQNWNIGKNKFVLNCSLKIQEDFKSFSEWLKTQDTSPFMNSK